MADVIVLRSSKDRPIQKAQREKAERALERVNAAVERIRAMTELYRDRLEGRRAR